MLLYGFYECGAGECGAGFSRVIFRTRAKELLEKLVSVSRDAGRSAAQDSAIIMDARWKFPSIWRKIYLNIYFIFMPDGKKCF